jgi:hypothetical protein
MSIVLEALKSSTDDYRKREYDETPLFSVPTGFTVYDYMNGEIGTLVNPNGNLIKYLNIGMIPGIHSAIGKTMSGKTSLFVRLAGNIVRSNPNSVFYFRDVEKTTVETRILALTNWTPQLYHEKLDYVRYNIDHDWIYNDIRRICQMKESLKDKILIDTGYKDSRGKAIKVFPPDVYLVDSLANLALLNDDEQIREWKQSEKIKDIKDEGVNKRTEGLQTAGSNKMLLSKVSDIVYKYNIRLILINHITQNTKLGVNPMYTKKQLQSLKQDEHIPGGAAYLHLCTNITKTECIGKLDADEFGPMIFGSRNQIIMIKNKNNISGVPVELIFDQRTGYNGILSAFNYIYNRRYGLEIGARSISFKCMPNTSFTKKTLWEKLVQDVKTYGEEGQLLKALLATARRCLYFDFVLGKPDPNVENWTDGEASRIAYDKGAVSK